MNHEELQKSFDELVGAITNMRNQTGSSNFSEELKLLYAQKHEWARHYNGLIWSVTAILLPIALGGQVLSYRTDPAATPLNNTSTWYLERLRRNNRKEMIQ